jgi:GGDEF domain-containing protein
LFFRVDLLTGCNNLVSFSRSLGENFGNKTLAPLSLIVIDVYQLRDINLTKGFEYGDSILRWMGIAIKDETDSLVYRISGDNFVAALIGDSHEAHQESARRLFDRLNGEALQLGPDSAGGAHGGHPFPGRTRRSIPPVVWKNINEKLELTMRGQPLRIFHADTSEADSATLHAIELMARRIETLGGTLQYTFRLAYTDPVSQSPNMLAIQRKLDFSLTKP